MNFETRGRPVNPRTLHRHPQQEEYCWRTALSLGDYVGSQRVGPIDGQ